MTTQPPNLVNLARQGNGKAIAALMNRSLQSKGIFARVVLQDGSLKVMLEGETTPDQAVFVPYVQQGIVALDIPNLHMLQVFGRVKGTTKPDWTETVSLQVETAIAQPEAIVEPVEPAIEINEDAIVSHLNQAIDTKDIAFSAEFVEDLLKITAKTDRLLEGDTFAKSIREALLGLRLQGIESVELYKQKTRGNARYKIKGFTLVQEAPLIAKPEKVEPAKTQESIANSAARMQSFTTQVDARPPKVQSKITQFIPTAIVIIVFLLIAITRVMSIAPSAAEQCRTSLIDKERCLLAVEIVGEQTIADAKKSAIASSEYTQKQSVAACSKFALDEAEEKLAESTVQKTKPRSSLEPTDIKIQEIFQGISLIDIQIANFKTPEKPVLRKACVVKHGQGVSRLLGIDTIPNNWPQQAYEADRELQKINRSLRAHEIFIVLGGNIIFTTIGLFIANMLNLGIRIFSIQTLLKTAVVIGTMETTLLLIPGMNLVRAIPFSVVALLLTQLVVKDLKVEWEDGYRVVAAGVGIVIIARLLLNWLVIGLFFSIA